jgi:hypothetical protein
MPGTTLVLWLYLICSFSQFLRGLVGKLQARLQLAQFILKVTCADLYSLSLLGNLEDVVDSLTFFSCLPFLLLSFLT